MGRPSKRTPATEKAILDALRAGSTRTAAAEAATVPRETLSRWMARNVTFRHAVLQAEAQAEIMMTVRLRQLADNGSVTAIMFWLERRRREDWGRQDRIEIIGSVRELARREGWDADEEALAVAEVERMLRAKRGQG